MKFVIIFAILSAILSAVLSSNCYDETCDGAHNKCCKKSRADGKGFTGACVKKLEDCPKGYTASRRRRRF